MSYSPDGEMMAVVTGRGIEVRNAETLQLLTIVSAYGVPSVTACVSQTEGNGTAAGPTISFSEDNSLLYVTDELWVCTHRIEDGTCLEVAPTIPGFDGVSRLWTVSSMVASHDRTVSFVGTTHGRVFIRDPRTGRTLSGSLTHAEDQAITGLAPSSQGRWLASAGEDHSVVLWDLSRLEEPKRWILPDDIKALAFSDDEETLRILCADGILHEKRVSFDNPGVSFLLSHRRIVRAVFGERGHALVFVDNDGGTFGWIDSDDSPVLRLPIESPASIIVHPNEPVACVLEKTWNVQAVRMVSLETGDCGAFYEYPAVLPVVALAASGDGTYLAVGDSDGAVHLFDTTSWARVGDPFSLAKTSRRWCRYLPTLCREVRNLRFGLDGRTLMVAGRIDIVAWDIGTGSWSAYAGGGTEPCLSPDVAWSAWFVEDAVEIHDNENHTVHTVVPTSAFPCDDPYGMRVLFTADSSTAILVCQEAVELIHFLDNVDPINVSVNNNAFTTDVSVAAVSPTDRLLAVADLAAWPSFNPHRIEIIDTVSGARLVEIEIPTEGDPAGIGVIAFDSSGAMLLVARRARVDVIGWETGTMLASLEGHQSDISHIEPIPQTSLIATAADDGSVFVWDLDPLLGD